MRTSRFAAGLAAATLLSAVFATSCKGPDEPEMPMTKAAIDHPEDLPPDVVKNIKVYERILNPVNAQGGDSEKVLVNAGGLFVNETPYEIASINVEVQLFGPSGAVEKSDDVTINRMADLGLRGLLLPFGNTTTTGSFVLDRKAFEQMTGYWVVVRSATGYLHPKEITNRGHFLAAVSRGDEATVKAALKEKPSLLKVLDPDTGMTAVHVAAARNRVAMLKMLAGLGADMNAKLKSGHHAIHFAATLKARDAVKYFLDQGVPVDLEFGGGYRALHYSAQAGDIPTMQLLIDRGAAVDKPSARGDTPLTAACYGGQVKAVELLLSKGARLNAHDSQGYTPVMRAAVNYTPDVLNVLLKKRVDVDEKLAENGKTALHLAAQQGRVQNLKILLAHGANRAIKDKDGQTAAQLAEASGQEACAVFLSAQR